MQARQGKMTNEKIEPIVHSQQTRGTEKEHEFVCINTYLYPVTLCLYLTSCL